MTWSTHLDPIFANNLERDSAVSWQYFGSTSGFLRRFPGTQWPHSSSTEKKSIHDFRTQDWFIQAASSPKDIVSWSSIFIPLKYLHCDTPTWHLVFLDDSIGRFRINVRQIF